MDDQRRLEIEASAFRGLVKHLQARSDVQNIDLMNLAGFCRNCLAKWFLAASSERGIDIDYDQAREEIYGMPYVDWQARFQVKASDRQKKRFEETKELHAKISGHN